jgi:hypothetical protein
MIQLFCQKSTSENYFMPELGGNELGGERNPSKGF